MKVLDSLGGPAPLLERLRRCRIGTLTNTDDYYGLGLAIGNAETRLLELANAYACLEAWHTQPYNLTPSAQNVPVRVGDADAAYLIADVLSDNDARVAAFGAESSLRFDFPVACKTGTSSNFATIGLLATRRNLQWESGSAISIIPPCGTVSGVAGAAPILHELLDYLHAHYGTSCTPARRTSWSGLLTL